jgi:hypothetical protein
MELVNEGDEDGCYVCLKNESSARPVEIYFGLVLNHMPNEARSRQSERHRTNRLLNNEISFSRDSKSHLSISPPIATTLL